MSAEQDLAQANVQIANLISEVTRFRDAAMGLNAIYPTITEGRQNTADGKYFSVPGNGAYMRLYRRQGSSAELIAEFPDRAELNSVIAQLGPLLGRGVVGGSGDLMAQGAFGLGASVPPLSVNVSQLDALNYTCFARLNQAIGGELDSDSKILHIEGGNSAIQFASRRGSATQRHRHRLGNPGTAWTAWEIPFSTRNILGTVSQSGGLPTGAIVERGSNANGEYVKFADGMLICTASTTSESVAASGNIFASPEVQWTFPSQFSTTSGLFCAGSGLSSSLNWHNTRATSTTAASLRTFSSTSIGGIVVMMLAIGRWY